MDKFKKHDDIDIFPDVRIEPDISEIIEAKPPTPPPQPRREHDEIFKNKTPIISEDVSPPVEGDKEDEMVNEILPPPKRKGRGKDKTKRKIKQSQAQKDALARGRKNRWEKDKAHKEAYEAQEAKKAEKAKKEEQSRKDLELQSETKIIEEPTPTIELQIERKPDLKQCHKPGRPNSIPSDFDTFCSYMDRYKTSRKSAKQVHPNKMVNKDLLPRAPMVSAPRTNNQRQTTNILDPNFAMKMLGARSNRSRFKDPFSRNF